MNNVFKALSDPTRRKVLALLRERPMSAGDLADRFAVSKPTMSAHFSVLSEAGLIEGERGEVMRSLLISAALICSGCAGAASTPGIQRKTSPVRESQGSHRFCDRLGVQHGGGVVVGVLPTRTAEHRAIR